MRRAIARALIISMLFVVPLLSGCQSESKKHLYKAEDLFEKRDLEGAQKELQLAIQADPNNLDAHKSLAHIDEFLGDQEGAAREYEAASALDPTDEKMLQKARMYRSIQEMINNASKAVDQVKSGDVEGGMRALKDALVASKSKFLRDKTVSYIQQAIPIAVAEGDQQVKDKKYADAINTYDQVVRGYMMLAEVNPNHTLDPAADAVIHSANEAAKAAGTPDATFKMLNDILAVDPDNKAANMELAQVYLSRTPPDYDTAADLEERANAPDADVKKLRDEAKRHRKG
ncbi:MAG: tetratricopeptide repeat protein [Candidatus Binataceae bacterium]